jgi:ATP-dependent helicase/nuclease subunit B
LSLRRRRDKEDGSPYDGDLNDLGEVFSARFSTTHTWSTSRLEAYRACPFLFFVGHVLGLEPREEPTEGLDVRQLGNIYHRILEHLYPTVDDPTDLDQLLAALPQVAGAVLGEAPRREGFRATAWWRQTRDEIVEHVRRSLEALAEAQGDFVPTLYEAAFGLGDQPELIVREGQDSFQVRGLIDRVDRTPDGRVRVIDYKAGGPSAFTNRAVTEGKKLQVPLYALAAREALGLGEPVDGFYWHVQRAEPSSFTLGRFKGGPEEAMALAVAHAWEAIRAARGGYFVPHPPDGGCPAWCPATGFCWHFKPSFKR